MANTSMMLAEQRFTPGTVVAGDSLRPLITLLVSVILILANAAAAPVYQGGSLRIVAVMALSTTLACLFLALSQFRRHIWSIATMMLLLISVFHLGLLIAPLFGRPLMLLTGSSVDWVYTVQTREAFWYVVMAITCYTVGVSAFGLVRGPERSQDFVPTPSFESAAAKVGAVLLVSAVISWFALVLLLLGLDAFRGSYLDFFEATSSSAISYSNLGIALGLVLVCVNPVTRWAKVGLVAYVVFALASLSIGARTTVMFPAAAASVVLAYRVRMPRVRWLAFIMLASVTVIGLIRAFRLGGAAGITWYDISQAPIRGFAELGYTIRVVQTSFLWHDVRSEPFRDGATYSGWIVRLLDSQVLQRALPSPDFRLMNVEISQRIGGLGGSVIGEAHHNFGLVGGLVLLGLLGFALAWIGRAPRTSFGAAVVGIVAVPLFLHVRNSFAPVVFSLICGLVLLQICRLVERRGQQ